jgi:hypothetical protein
VLAVLESGHHLLLGKLAEAHNGKAQLFLVFVLLRFGWASSSGGWASHGSQGSP